MQEKIVILTLPGCEGCEQLETDIKDKSKVAVYDVTKSDKGARIAMDNKVHAAPTALLKTARGYEKCSLGFQAGKVIVSCKGKKFIL